MVIRQKKAWRRREGVFVYFEDMPASTVRPIPGVANVLPVLQILFSQDVDLFLQ